MCQQTDWKQGITRSSDRGSGGAGSKLNGRQRGSTAAYLEGRLRPTSSSSLGLAKSRSLREACRCSATPAMPGREWAGSQFWFAAAPVRPPCQVRDSRCWHHGRSPLQDGVLLLVDRWPLCELRKAHNTCHPAGAGSQAGRQAKGRPPVSTSAAAARSVGSGESKESTRMASMRRWALWEASRHPTCPISCSTHSRVARLSLPSSCCFSACAATGGVGWGGTYVCVWAGQMQP